MKSHWRSARSNAAVCDIACEQHLVYQHISQATVLGCQGSITRKWIGTKMLKILVAMVVLSFGAVVYASTGETNACTDDDSSCCAAHPNSPNCVGAESWDDAAGQQYTVDYATSVGMPTASSDSNRVSCTWGILGTLGGARCRVSYSIFDYEVVVSCSWTWNVAPDGSWNNVSTACYTCEGCR